ncbi:unnamed protein product [Gongylonema pulchrum]|uniref:Secreted protein n=1 Tax=Gongylonema pulchrum TaxID=637853 RepID=A0A183D9P4_9BILA|nr:unnamed protein product [Gongylonema pulchrum]
MKRCHLGFAILLCFVALMQLPAHSYALDQQAVDAFKNYLEELYNKYFKDKTKIVKTIYKMFNWKLQKAAGSEAAKTYVSKVLKLQLNLCAPIDTYKISDGMANKVPKHVLDEAARIWKSINADEFSFRNE